MDGAADTGMDSMVPWVDAASDGAVDLDSGVLPPPPPCGGPSTIHDDFGAAATSDHWYAWGAGSGVLEQRGGAVHFTPIPDAGMGYSSRPAVNFHEDRLTTEMTFNGVDSSQVSASMVLRRDEGNLLGFHYQSGMLYFQTYVGGSDTVGTPIPYDPVAHRWWQLREEAGTVYWETSADGLSWTPQHSIGTPAFADVVWIDLLAWNSGTTGGEVAFHHVNGDPMHPETGFCPVSSFTDDFEDTTVAPQWIGDSEPGCLLVENGGHARFGIPVGLASVRCAYATATVYDADAQAITLVLSPGDLVLPTNSGFSFYVSSPRDQYAGFDISDGYLSAWDDSTGSGDSIAHDADTTHLRILIGGGISRFLASSDGTTFNPVGEFASTFDVSRTRVEFGLYAEAGIAFAASASVGHYNP